MLQGILSYTLRPFFKLKLKYIAFSLFLLVLFERRHKVQRCLADVTQLRSWIQVHAVPPNTAVVLLFISMISLHFPGRSRSRFLKGQRIFLFWPIQKAPISPKHTHSAADYHYQLGRGINNSLCSIFPGRRKQDKMSVHCSPSRK